MKNKRILSRTLAQEIPLEDLGLTKGAVDSVAPVKDPGGPVLSTLVATLPSYKEDQ